MAKLTVNPAKTEVKVVEVSPATYTLELSEKEMVVLTTYVGNTCGNPSNSEFRRIVDKLWEDVFHSFLKKTSSIPTITAPKGDLKV